MFQSLTDQLPFTQSPFDQLPIEIIIMILEYITYSDDIIAIRLVNKKFRMLIENSVHTINYTYNYNIPISTLLKFKFIRMVKIPIYIISLGDIIKLISHQTLHDFHIIIKSPKRFHIRIIIFALLFTNKVKYSKITIHSNKNYPNIIIEYPFIYFRHNVYLQIMDMSILKNAGFKQLISPSIDEYIIALASDYQDISFINKVHSDFQITSPKQIRRKSRELNIVSQNLFDDR